MINNSETCLSYLILDASTFTKKKSGSMCSETPLTDTYKISTLFLGTNYKLLKT